MPQLPKKWVMSCNELIKESQIDNRLIRTPSQNPIEHNTGPEDAMQTFPVNPSKLSGAPPEKTPRKFKSASRNNTERLLHLRSVVMISLGMKSIFYSTSLTRLKTPSTFSGPITTICRKTYTNYNWSESTTGNLRHRSSTVFTTALRGPDSFKVPTWSCQKTEVFFCTGETGGIGRRTIQQRQFLLAEKRTNKSSSSSSLTRTAAITTSPRKTSIVWQARRELDISNLNNVEEVHFRFRRWLKKLYYLDEKHAD